MGLDTPVLFIIFNRPDTTYKVFSSILQAQPKQLFIAADGPREDKIGEQQNCQQTRDIVKQVDWDCEIRTLFQEKNLGCGRGPVSAPATAISWFFDNVEEGIILEDDCLPHPDFFVFCEQLLDYYRNNERIMIVSGNNFQYGRKRGKASYYFSHYRGGPNPIWGWATWRRAWKHYDYESLPEEARKCIWDTQWMMLIRKHSGLLILPNVNLVSNIGFGPDATHTQSIHRYANWPTENMVFPLVHPTKISPDRAAERYSQYSHFFGETTLRGAIKLVYRRLLQPPQKRTVIIGIRGIVLMMAFIYRLIGDMTFQMTTRKKTHKH